MFLGVDVGLVFFDGVLPRLLLYTLALHSRNVRKNSFHVRSSVFWASFSLSSFFRRCRFLFFQEIKLRANRTRPTLHFLVLSLFFFCPRRTGFISRFGRASFLSRVFFGVPFWAPGVLAFFGFSRYCVGGLRLLPPF